MKRVATIVVVVVGLGVGAGLYAANNALTTDPGPASKAPVAQVEPARPPVATATPVPSPSPSPAGGPAASPPPRGQAQEKVTVTWAGTVRGGRASIAIAVKDGVAVGYVCDGNRVEAWFRGTAVDERLALAGTDGRVTGAFDRKRAKGTVNAGRYTYTFDVAEVRKPSGLYRATAEVRDAKVVGGWIVVDGKQVGILEVNGEPQAAPPLELPAGSVTVNGVPIEATPLG